MPTQKTKINSNREMENIANHTCDLGDHLLNSFYSNNDLKVAQSALKAYNTSINAQKTRILNKKLTGEPKKIKGI